MITLKRYLAPVITTCCTLLLLAGCAERAPSDKGTIKLATGNWPEGIAVSKMLEIIIGEMGYTVEFTMADPAMIFTAIYHGNQDAMIETWLPVFHKPYFEKYGSKYEIISTWFDNAKLGFVVPEYVDIDSIEDLNAVADKFDGRIIGIDAGSSTMQCAREVVEGYDLDYELISASEPAMLSVLKDAYKKREWIVIIGWEPHTKFAHFDLKFLEDPKDIWGASEPEKIQVTARKGFSEEYPELADFFGKMKFDSAQIGSLMEVAVNSAPYNEVERVTAWMRQNRELVNSWLPEQYHIK